MNKTIQALLQGKGENHILPFFWQHGEDEATLREYMGAIQGAGCGAVCVESRPHPDFCGPKWWQDMDVILDEARRRDMKVWILDDSHFPTGYCNGALENAPENLCRQGICAIRREYAGEAEPVKLNLLSLLPPQYEPIGLEAFILPTLPTPRHYEDDAVLRVTAVERTTGETRDLTAFIENGVLRWQRPAGSWTLWAVFLSRNLGYHRNYMNMLDKRSCHTLIEAVYEPHWQRYQEDFGKTIAGFFSDEPELGSGHMYFMEGFLGTDQDLPFGADMPVELEKRLGPDWAGQMYLLWENSGNKELTARVRYAFMDAVTKLVREAFSYQIGDWCQTHGVQYIGHVVEDSNAHSRPGASLGHYFRGLNGQHMAGIDLINNQVLPQVTEPKKNMFGATDDSEFYQFAMAKLASSAAAIEPRKQGRAMCECFGAYGWSEGVRLEKYLIDHLLVQGINQFVPHAFSPAPFPDPDCPPHFYAHGHNPQYRHFGRLMEYANRAAELLSSGANSAQVAVLYHGDAEWAGEAMLSQKPARVLTEAQIDFDIIPCDVFDEPDRYCTAMDGGLTVNGKAYGVLVIPYAEYVPGALADALKRLEDGATEIIFLEGLPKGVCSGSAPAAFERQQVLPTARLAEHLRDYKTVRFTPENKWLRALRVHGESEIFFLTNEGSEPWEGEITLPCTGPCYGYDSYENRVFSLEPGNGAALRAALLPLHSLTVVCDELPTDLPALPAFTGKGVRLTNWTRSTCEGAAYPAFEGAKEITLPDRLAEEQPQFSGFVRYETKFDRPAGKVLLEISDAAEGVEVFVNGVSAGLQIVPPFRYDLTKLTVPGVNILAIEVATTLERECYAMNEDNPMARMMPGGGAPTSPTGLTGDVILYGGEE